MSIFDANKWFGVATIFEKVRRAFCPEASLPYELRKKWKIYHRDSYLSSTNPILIGLAILSPIHLLFVDLRSGFSPTWLFVLIRLSIATFSIVAIFVGKSISNFNWYKLPYVITLSLFSIGQLVLMSFESRIPFFIGIMLLALSCIGMGLSLGNTFILTTVLYVTSAPLILQILPIDTVPDIEQLISNYLIVVLSCCFFRAKIFKEVHIFMLNEQNIQLIEREARAVQAKVAEEVKLGHLASQVAHDLRSPLSALKVVVANLKSLDESDRFLFQKSLTRIGNIANELLSQAKGVSINLHKEAKLPTEDQTLSPIKNYQISALIEDVLAEIKLQYQSHKSLALEFEVNQLNSELYAQVQSSDFKRLISNLLNNAVEAIEDKGRIQIHLSLKKVVGKSDQIMIVIEDDGKGIDPIIQNQLGQRGFSFEKPNGNGLGLHYAIFNIQKWGGKLSIESALGIGTKVRICLPRSKDTP